MTNINDKFFYIGTYQAGKVSSPQQFYQTPIYQKLNTFVRPYNIGNNSMLFAISLLPNYQGKIINVISLCTLASELYR